MGIAVASNVRGESERAATNMDETKAMFVARGAIDRAALYMLWARMYQTAEGPWPYGRNGDPTLELSFPTAEVHVEIIPETSKLNLNAATEEELFRLLIALGLPEDRAVEITTAILDWRTPIVLNNAGVPDRQSPFDPFYLSQTPSFLATHASFLENEEMLLLKGVTPDLYYGTFLPPGAPKPGLRDCLSVRGSYGALDINHVQPAVMAAVGIAPADAAAIAELRRTNPVRDYNQLGAIATNTRTSGSALDDWRTFHVYAACDSTPAPTRWQALRHAAHGGRAGEDRLPRQSRQAESEVRSGAVV